MGRLFFKLYAFMALAAIVFFIGVANVDRILHGTFEYHLGNLMRGPIHLLEERLQNVPEARWPQVLSAINRGGGYQLELLPIEAAGLPPKSVERMERGEVVVFEVYQAKYIYKRMSDSQWVLQFPFEQSGYLHAQQLANSTFNLIESELRDAPMSEWPTVLMRLNTQFGYPVTLIEEDTTGPKETAGPGMASRADIVYEFENDEELFYRNIANTPYSIRLGPFDDPVTLTYLQSVMGLVFALLVALAVLFWVYPLWRDLNRLNTSTRAFGQGDFSVRVVPGKHSVLFRLAGTFNDMADRIQGLISSHKDLTNAVSHELRTPIARLRFAMEMLEGSANPEDRTRYAASMSNDIDELDHLVAELLTYARFDRVRPVLEFQRLEIQPWLDEAIHQAGFGTRDLVIDYAIADPELKHAQFDPVLMSRALSNLLQNAKRYARSRISVTFSKVNGDFQLSVDDDGNGVPEAEREQIFDPFRRLDASRDRETGGYGLGLSIVQRVVYWHGGEVGVTNAPSGGARFVMRWPETSGSAG